jgi:hypothetical protein
MSCTFMGRVIEAWCLESAILGTKIASTCE